MTVFDIHTHGISGVDTQTTDPRDILRIAEVHGTEGVDAILAAIYPAPLDAMRAAMAAVKEAMRWQRSRFGAGSSEKERGEPAVILGAYLEGPFLNPIQAGTLDASSFLAPSVYGLDRLLDGFEDIVRIVVIAPELPGALPLIHTIADRGIRVSMGHSDASWREAEAGFLAGAKGVTHLFNAMRPWHHREPGLAGFALTNRDLYVEVIADPYHLHRGGLDLVFKVKDPVRIILVSDSIRDTGRHGSEEALADPSGRLQGGSLTIAAAARRLIDLGYPAKTVDEAITVNPEAYIAR